MSGGLEVFLISSYYSRRRATASGLKIAASRPVPTIWRDYRFAPGTLTSPACPPIGFSWSVASESTELDINEHSFCCRVMYRTEDLRQPLVIEGSYKEGLYHYTMQIWDCNQVTLELTQKLYESKISSPQAFWLLNPKQERLKYGDPFDNIAKKMIKLGPMNKLQYFNKYKGNFRLVVTNDFLMFEDAFGSGVNYHWRLSFPKQNWAVHVHRSVDQVALSIILQCVFQQGSTCSSASLKKLTVIRRDLIHIGNWACEKLVSQKMGLLARQHAQLIVLILDYFVKPLVPDWDLRTGELSDTLRVVYAVAAETSTVQMTFLHEQLTKLTMLPVSQLISQVLQSHIKFEQNNPDDPWAKSIEALGLAQLKDWFLEARNPENARTHGLLWRFKMYSPQFFIDFFCQHLSTGPGEVDLKTEVFFGGKNPLKLRKAPLTNFKDGQRQILQRGELRLMSHNYSLRIYDSQDKYLLNKNAYSFSTILSHGDSVLLLHQPYQDGQLMNIELSVQRKKFQEFWLSSLYVNHAPELQAMATSTGGQPGGDFLVVVAWKDKQPLGNCKLGAFHLCSNTWPGTFSPSIDKKFFVTLEQLGLEQELAESHVERSGLSYYNRNTVSMVFGSFGVYRLIYFDEKERQKWILVCLEIKLGNKGFSFQNRGYVQQEGISTSQYGQVTHVKGFNFGKKFVLLQLEIDYTLTIFTIHRNKFMVCQKHKNTSSLVRDHLRLDPSMGINLYWGQTKNKAVLCMVYTGPKGQKSTTPETERPWLIRVAPISFK